MMSFSEQLTLTVRHKDLCVDVVQCPQIHLKCSHCLTGIGLGMLGNYSRAFAKLDKFLSKISLVPHQL